MSLPNFPGQSQVTDKTLEELRKETSEGIKNHFLWHRVASKEDVQRLIQLMNITKPVPWTKEEIEEMEKMPFIPLFPYIPEESPNAKLPLTQYRIRLDTYTVHLLPTYLCEPERIEEVRRKKLIINVSDLPDGASWWDHADHHFRDYTRKSKEEWKQKVARRTAQLKAREEKEKAKKQGAAQGQGQQKDAAPQAQGIQKDVAAQEPEKKSGAAVNVSVTEVKDEKEEDEHEGQLSSEFGGMYLG